MENTELEPKIIYLYPSKKTPTDGYPDRTVIVAFDGDTGEIIKAQSSSTPNWGLKDFAHIKPATDVGKKTEYYFNQLYPGSQGGWRTVWLGSTTAGTRKLHEVLTQYVPVPKVKKK